MSESRFVVGIDLGTTNSVLAYAEAHEDRKPEIRLFEVPQLVAPSTVETRPLLPSFLYIPGEHELPAGSLTLPWSEERREAVGDFARQQGGLVADRLVHSSKSWLCHEGVDRRAAILPWGSGEAEFDKLSPVQAAVRILEHFRDAWNHVMARDEPARRLENQDLILTVPASFDEVARELTVEAAKESGFDEARLVLLEEPQAAFYAWLGGDPEKRKGQIKPGEQVLVVDMGGGTTDLSLFSAAVSDEDVAFERTAVGEHLLLGGDNIDLALARLVEQRFKDKTAKLSVRQWQTLLQSCRAAKEKLLDPEGPDAMTIAIPGKGRKLLGGQLKHTVTREELVEQVLSGFFPEVKKGDKAEKRSKAGLQEFGLPFEPDPAVTRHLLGFLQDHCTRDGKLKVPRALLFNGGVFKTEALRQRITAVLGAWSGGADGPLVLDGGDLDLAVAWGAAYYGLVRRGYGVRIRGGLPRSYYLGLETEEETRRALCLIPRGLEAGEDVGIEGHDLVVRTRIPVAFPLLTSTTRLGDKTSDIVTVDSEGFRELPPLLTVLKLGRKSRRKEVPVRLTARLTEIGTLELYCRSTVTHHQWRLNFSVRGSGGGDTEDVWTDEQKKAAARAVDHLGDVFRGKRGFDEAREMLEGLVKRLEKILGERRDSWPVHIIRLLWDRGLEPVMSQRGKTALHESRWLNLAGLCLRPGFGAVSDDHRVRSLWKVFLGGMQNANDQKLRVEWLVTCRRVAGGLTRGQQEQLVSRLAPLLKLKSTPKKGARQEEMNEAWRVAASLENLPVARKQELGQSLLKAVKADKAPRCYGWALGRIGARLPIYGTLDNQISPDLAAAWIEQLLPEAGAELEEERAFALVQMARLTGDRSLDIEPKLRERVGYRLKKAGCEPRLLRALQEATRLAARDQASALGDSIPVGLSLVK